MWFQWSSLCLSHKTCWKQRHTRLLPASGNLFFTCPLGSWACLFFSYISVIPSRFYYLTTLPLSDFTVLERFYAQYFSTPPSYPLVISASLKVLRTMRTHVWLSCVWLFVTPWSVACQVPLSMAFSRQEYWSGLPFPSPGDLPDPGMEPGSSALQADSLPSEPPGQP